jgi:hypothetical protein
MNEPTPTSKGKPKNTKSLPSVEENEPARQKRISGLAVSG